MSDPPEAEADRVHVRVFPLDLPTIETGTLSKLLSDDERARAARFRFDRDRNRYIVARGRLRQTLSRYLAVAPESVEFVYSEDGKPFLSDTFHEHDLFFNLSHSEDLGAIAVLRGKTLGVDVERIDTTIDPLELATHYFAPPETALLSSLPEDRRHAVFYTLWARKEAYLKALGSGLMAPLSEFAVTPTDSEITLLSRDGTVLGLAPWRVLPFEARPGFAAAVAVPASITRVAYPADGSFSHSLPSNEMISTD